MNPPRKIPPLPLPRTPAAVAAGIILQKPAPGAAQAAHVVQALKAYHRPGVAARTSPPVCGGPRACDACKERIRRFIALWQEQAQRLMNRGIQASLTVIYKYTNEAYQPRGGERHRDPPQSQTGAQLPVIVTVV
jgi:hypothetical protein